MAGAFTDGDSLENLAAQDKLAPSEDGKTEDGKLSTDVNDVFADAEVKVGTETFPVFDVSDNEFHQNMTWGRKRVRFNNETPAANYMRGSRYNRPFFIRNTDKQGKTYTRRIK